MKLRLIVIVIIFLSLFSASMVLAKKKLVRLPQSTVTSAAKHKLRADRQALLLVLDDMTKATSVTYNLTYVADNVSQGVQGTYAATQGNTQKELVFGTCSKDVCTYHKNITDMILEVKTALKSGKTLVQKYQIKP
ncbi:MAG: hypothetical protein NTZ93_03020 [Candidatus Beckwithbacteria bacterium]|nr:hypothetical protein [Candidatus Beckwithbacteria bacterium]